MFVVPVLDDLLLEKDDKIWVAKLNRPEALNALRKKTLLELEGILDGFSADGTAAALVITGAGEKAFCTGGDVKAMEKMTKEDAVAFARLAHRVLGKIEEIPKPIISAVNGYALGAGCDLAAECDICVASEGAVFGETSPGVGVITPFGGTQRLPRIVGPSWTKFLMFTGETIDAKTAFQIGLVNKVVPHEALMDEAKKVAKEILTRAPVAVAYCKKLVNYSLGAGLDEGDRLEVELYGGCFETDDRKEGTKAFLEKRKPVFVGK